MTDSQDASMEDILASIRKILSDDGEPAAPPAPEPDPAPVMAPPPPKEEVVDLSASMLVEKGNPEMTEPITSPTAAASSLNSLNSLTGAILRERESLLGNGTLTIEDIVKEIVKPMLKEWLDANLPALVERRVQYEIEQIAQKVTL